MRHSMIKKYFFFYKKLVLLRKHLPLFGKKYCLQIEKWISRVENLQKNVKRILDRITKSLETDTEEKIGHQRTKFYKSC